jgi:hypothetical protein
MEKTLLSEAIIKERPKKNNYNTNKYKIRQKTEILHKSWLR